MSDEVLIFGKDTWPFTKSAREAFAQKGKDVNYFDVTKDAAHLEQMLKHSGGKRKVPTIVEGEAVTIGFEGNTWGV